MKVNEVILHAIYLICRKGGRLQYQMVEQFMDVLSYKWGKIEMSIIYSSISALYNMILSYVFLIITVDILCISYWLNTTY